MNIFNSNLYYNLYSDLRENNINTDEKLRLHWISNGYNEKRVSCINDFIKTFGFDYKFYIKNYPDLKKYNIQTELEAVNHWIKYGFSEKRIYNNYFIKEEDKSIKEEEKLIILDKIKPITIIDTKPIITPTVFNENKSFFKLGNNKFNLSKIIPDNRTIAIIKIDEEDKNICKGINIDIDIIKHVLDELKFTSIETIQIPSDKLSFYAYNKNEKSFNFSTNFEFYIFSEIVLYDLFIYLLLKKKKHNNSS